MRTLLFSFVSVALSLSCGAQQLVSLRGAPLPDGLSVTAPVRNVVTPANTGITIVTLLSDGVPCDSKSIMVK